MDFLAAHFGRHTASYGMSPGVLIVSQRRPLGRIIEELVLIWSVSEPQEWMNRIIEIPR